MTVGDNCLVGILGNMKREYNQRDISHGLEEADGTDICIAARRLKFVWFFLPWGASKRVAWKSW